MSIVNLGFSKPVVLSIKLIFALFAAVAFEILREAFGQSELLDEFKLENAHLHNVDCHEFTHELIV